MLTISFCKCYPIVEIPRRKIDGFEKSQKINFLSFRSGSGSGMTAKPESSDFSMFWMPDQVRHDECGLFTRPSELAFRKIWEGKDHDYRQ
jgi:hypothetical protein